MSFFAKKFKDFTMKSETLEAKVRFSVFGWRFDRAQEWLDKEIMNRMEPVIPYRTGEFLRKIKEDNAGRVGTGTVRTAVPPQGRYLYPGVSPRTGKPFHWTNPKTEPFWGKFVIRTYKHELEKGVKDIIMGRK